MCFIYCFICVNIIFFHKVNQILINYAFFCRAVYISYTVYAIRSSLRTKASPFIFFKKNVEPMRNFVVFKFTSSVKFISSPYLNFFSCKHESNKDTLMEWRYSLYEEYTKERGGAVSLQFHATGAPNRAALKTARNEYHIVVPWCQWLSQHLCFFLRPGKFVLGYRGFFFVETFPSHTITSIAWGRLKIVLFCLRNIFSIAYVMGVLCQLWTNNIKNETVRLIEVLKTARHNSDTVRKSPKNNKCKIFFAKYVPVSFSVQTCLRSSIGAVEPMFFTIPLDLT